MNVAYVTYGPSATAFSDPAVGINQSGILSVLGPAGYSLVIEHLEYHEPEELERLRRLFLQGRIDGALLAAMPPGRAVDALASWPFPIVAYDQPAFSPDVPVVCGPYREGMMLAVRHLFGRGRRRLAFVGGPDAVKMPLHYNVERSEGYRDGLAAVGLPFDPRLIAHADYTFHGGRAALRALLVEQPDAVVAANDAMAVGVVQEAKAAGLRVPEDLAVTGFDDFEIAQYVDPALTTVRHPVREMGARSAEMLLAHLDGRLASHEWRVLLPTRLVVRGST